MPTWFILAILGTFFGATYLALVKKFVSRIHEYILAGGVYLAASLVMFVIAWQQGIPRLSAPFFYILPLEVILSVIGVILTYRALKITDFSLAVPMHAFTPAFMVFTSLVILREIPSLYGAGGILLVVLGSYVMNLSPKQGGPSGPFKALLTNQGVRYMLAVGLISSVTLNLGKVLFTNSNVIFATACSAFLYGVTFMVLAKRKKLKVFKALKKHAPIFLLITLVLVLAWITSNNALMQTLVPYVGAIRQFSIVFGLVYGMLLFREKNLSKRSLAVVIMLVGAVILAILA